MARTRKQENDHNETTEKERRPGLKKIEEYFDSIERYPGSSSEDRKVAKKGKKLTEKLDKFLEDLEY